MRKKKKSILKDNSFSVKLIKYNKLDKIRVPNSCLLLKIKIKNVFVLN